MIKLKGYAIGMPFSLMRPKAVASQQKRRAENNFWGCIMPNLYELTAKHFVAENRSIAQLEKRANDIAEKIGEDAREKFIMAIFAEIHRGVIL